MNRAVYQGLALRWKWQHQSLHLSQLGAFQFSIFWRRCTSESVSRLRTSTKPGGQTHGWRTIGVGDTFFRSAALRSGLRNRKSNVTIDRIRCQGGATRDLFIRQWWDRNDWEFLNESLVEPVKVFVSPGYLNIVERRCQLVGNVALKTYRRKKLNERLFECKRSFLTNLSILTLFSAKPLSTNTAVGLESILHPRSFRWFEFDPYR